jgi:hypothetical protein
VAAGESAVAAAGPDDSHTRLLVSGKTPKTELARARRSLRKAERSIEHRAELVRARAIARELSETLVDSGEDRLEALEIFRDTWRVEMSALGGHGDRARELREWIEDRTR